MDRKQYSIADIHPTSVTKMMAGAIARSSATGIASRLASFLLNVIGLPVALDYLGTERFGLFLMLTGLASIASIANFGLSRIVALHTSRRSERSVEFVAQVFRTVSIFGFCFGLAVFVVLTAATRMLPWHSLIPKVDSLTLRDFSDAAVALASIMGLWVFMTPFEGLATGLHRLATLNSFRICGFLINIAGMIMILPSYPSITTCVILFSSGIVLGDLLHAVYLTITQTRIIIGTIRLRRTLLRSTFRDAISGALNSAGFAGIFQFSTGLLGIISGPSEVVVYGLIMRMLIVGLSILHGYYGAVWPALARALSYPSERHLSVRLIKQSLFVATAAGTAGLLTVVTFGELMFSLWLRHPIQFGLTTRLSSAALCLAVALELALKSILFAFGEFRYAATTTAIQATTYLLICSLIMPVYGGPGALALLFVLYFSFALPCLALRFVRRVSPVL